MEIVEEEQHNQAMETSDHQEVQDGANACNIVKGKRTKRQRPPHIDAINHHIAAKSEEVSSDISNDVVVTTTTPNEDWRCCNTEEEEDMANCLILLAQGQSLDSSSSPNNKGSPQITNSHKEIKFTSRKFLETPNGSKSGYYVYECKTCFKIFPSFQALGGHRASHMRPKKDDEIVRFSLANEDTNNNNNLDSSYSLALNLGPNKASLYSEDEFSLGNNAVGKRQRIHKCSTCGAKFSSGQALGGHMRRHRRAIGGVSSGRLFSHCNFPKVTTLPTLSFTRLMGNASVAMDNEGLTTSMEGSKLSLDLDLNMPALSDDDPSRILLEATTQKEKGKGKQSSPISPPPPMQQQEKLVLMPTSLVDCHY